MNIKSLLTRTGVGILYIALVLVALLDGEMLFASIFSIFLGIALYEYYRLIEDKDKPNHKSIIFNTAFGVGLFIIYCIYPRLLFVGALAFIYIVSTALRAILSKQNDSLQKGITNMFGQLYITAPFILLAEMSGLYNFYGRNFEQHILFIFIFIWINDTFAYLTGSMIGKRKLLEHVSPKKTIEGFIGGLTFTVLAGFLIGVVSQGSIGFHNQLYWIVFAFIVSVFGTLGDLFESLIKRTYNTKDSGKILPGHGGMLDRIDSLLFAIPAIYVYTKINYNILVWLL